MRAQGISLISTGEGIQVVKTVNLFTYAASPSPPTDLFVFHWKLTDTQTTRYILEAARDRVTDDMSDFMHNTDLYCTAHVFSAHQIWGF